MRPRRALRLLEEVRPGQNSLVFRARAAYEQPAFMLPKQFQNVTAVAKANVYFDGKVVSHTVLFPDGSKKTLGLVYPGSFHFGTQAAERMEIVAGNCRVKLDGQDAWKEYATGQAFEVPARSGFDIEVKKGLCEYVCSFLP